jgi:hypothetical protein
VLFQYFCREVVRIKATIPKIIKTIESIRTIETIEHGTLSIEIWNQIM